MRSLIFAAALALALPAEADTYEERLAVAKEYVEATMADFDMAKMIRQMWVPVADQVAANGKELTEAQKADIDALYQATFTDPMWDIMRGQDVVMAELLTLEEITAVRDFYMTDNGRSVMMKLPDIFARQQPLIMGMVQETMPAVMPQLMQIIEREE